MNLVELNPLALVAVTVGLSAIPVILWGMVFLSKSEEKRYMIVKTFLFGALLVLPLIFYRDLWSVFPEVSLLKSLQYFEDSELRLWGVPLSLTLFYISVGVIEEVLKAFVVNKVDRNEVNAIKDAVEFSIMVALGFAFAENTFYFIQSYQNLGGAMLMEVFVFRTIFSTFAHILFSAIYGYHFGLAIFAKKIYRKKQEESYIFKIITNFLNLFSKKKTISFETKNKFLGLFYASALHAIFNILLEARFVAFLLPFLAIGVVHVSYLLYNYKNHVVYNPEKK